LMPLSFRAVGLGQLQRNDTGKDQQDPRHSQRVDRLGK
jgi:hypothetical protein